MKDFYYYTGFVVITTIGVIGLLIISYYLIAWFMNLLSRKFKTMWMMVEYGYYRKQFKDWIIGKAVIFPKGAGLDLGNKYMEDYYWSTKESHFDNYETLNDYLDNHLPSDFNVLVLNTLYCEILNTKTNEVFQVNAMGNGDSNNHKVTFEFLHYVH